MQAQTHTLTNPANGDTKTYRPLYEGEWVEIVTASASGRVIGRLEIQRHNARVSWRRNVASGWKRTRSQ